ncbi:PLP-dependent aminotransferase family protein [Marinobacterium mangrovicola]|uniref:DNA-binding transcriptional MocR family regulator n=1 Tax=Marinobacterium mangrovicola TaxID=1476959 RepID=A0A4R1GPJ1_9GAMM|nr:PLP-dependent aminotransferase family protein [Marinobacterium mangrovicola]TCK09230.1 DNA-binding transcriptional MocR family regulator [Marinobacterium mangrovicola]
MQVATHLQHIHPSYIREILAAATAEGIISLAGGLPATDRFPLSLMAESIAELPRHAELFQYGETAGYRPLLDHLENLYQVASSHRMMVCSGSQQGLDLIARTFLNPGDGVAMEAPSYPGALQVFGMARAAIHPVQQHRDGPDLDALESLFASGQVKLFYAVPDFHNPTGVCWTLEVRQKVASLCDRYGVALIEDAPYRELRFAGKELPLVSTFCPERALVLRSFSKIATPGIRLGMLSGPRDWLPALIRVKQASDLHSSIPMQALILDLITHPGFPGHIRQLCDLYSERYQALATALSEYLGEGFDAEPVQGGMFLWLKLPVLDSAAVARAALTKRVAVVPSTAFYPKGVSAEPALRLNFSHEAPDTLREAVRRLARVLI